jgi:alpha-methylacyl-CoA racemase
VVADMSAGPLAGVRVVELAGIGPGPHCGMLLADLGADVVRIDRPGGPSPAVPPHADIAGRGKRSVIVDLKDPRGLAVARRLVAAADVLIEGYRPGVAERLGLGPDACWDVNPRLVYGRMTGWGQDGPLAHAAGHDIGYIAITGALHAIGEAGGPPRIPVNYVGDFGGGSMFLALGVVSALLSARATGRGRVVDAAIVDGAASLQAMTFGMLASGVWRDERGVNFLDGGAPYYGVYATADGRHMAVGALERQFYAQFTELLFAPDPVPDGLPGQHDQDRWPELRSVIAARFATRTRAEWTKVFEGTDACVSPVLSMTEAATHPHLAARGTYVTSGGVLQPAPAPRFSAPAGAAAPAAPAGDADAADAARAAGAPRAGAAGPGRAGPIPAPGEHTREILAELGVRDIDALLADGVVSAPAELRHRGLRYHVFRGGANSYPQGADISGTLSTAPRLPADNAECALSG